MTDYELNIPEREIENDPLWIGVVGAAGAGKDLFAEVIAEAWNVHVPYLAAPIKEVGMEYYRMTRGDCYTHEGKASEHEYMTFDDGTPMTNRNVLEQIGDKLQELDPLVLIRHAEQEIKELDTTPDLVVMPDLRTEPQADFIRDRGGMIVYVQRDEKEEEAENAQGDDAHHTKTFYDRTDWDIKVENNKSIEAFEDVVDFLFDFSLVPLIEGK